MNLIGMDIGGTNIVTVLCNEQEETIYQLNRKTDHYENDYIRNIIEAIEILINYSSEKIKSIGIGIPGMVDSLSGKVIASAALGWENLNLKKIIEDKFNIPTAVGNDVNHWTIAEKYLGKAKGCKDFAVITIGTGIGCGLYLNNQLYKGSNNEAGEIGYLPLGLEAFNKKYTYKDFGFLESKASAYAVSRKYYELTGKDLTCDEVFKLSIKDDQPAIEIKEQTYKYISLGIASIINILNPEKIIIGGGMANEGQKFLEEISSYVSSLTPLKCEICLSELGETGGALGSAVCGTLCSKQRGE